jgi:hypothetical protein
MVFQPGLLNRALSNGEMFRQVQTMPVTANDPRPKRSQELMDYVSEGTEGQWKDPDKRPSAKSLAPKSPGEQTETGKQITGALGGIGQGLATLFSEKPAAPKQERPVLPMQTRDNYVEEGTHGQNWDLIRLGMDAQEQERKKQERAKASRGHFDEGHR